MARIRLTEMESNLYETLDSYRKTVDQLIENVNSRNAERVDETRKGIRNSAVRKKFFSLLVLIGGTVVAAYYYKTLGVL